MFCTDSIFARYLLNFTFIKDIRKFNRAIKNLKLNTRITNSNSSEAIHSYFWQDKLFFFLCFLRYQSLNKFFSETHFKGILISDENSPQQKVFQYAARKNGVKTFGFQHGNIHNLHPSYMYGMYKSKPLLPDITFVWGTYFTDLLIQEGGYKHYQLRASGRVVPTTRIIEPLKLPHTSKRKILYASQPQRDQELRTILMQDILRSVKQNEELCELVIRPHPRETDDAFFRTAADNVGFHNFTIDRSGKLHQHLEWCDALVVAFSTVGTEFIQYYKPMYVLDYLHQDLINWIEEGVGIRIGKQEDLTKELSKSNPKINYKVYQNFIRKYYITGNHVLENIQRSIEEKEDFQIKVADLRA